tara:strand:- start:39437 stop:40072 length:636 start_codon:yes stop_codon:yes gene_type:complete
MDIEETVVPTDGIGTPPGGETTPPVDGETTPPVDGENSTADGETPSADDSGSDDNTVPEVYADFTLPDEIVLNEQVMGGAAELFKADGLTQAQAQKYIDLAADLVQQTSEGQAGAYEQQKQGWYDQSKADPDFGGDKFDETVGLAQLGLSKVGTPELNALLQETGLGNHPEIIRAMRNVGNLMKEDNPGGGLPNSKQSDRISTLYPTSPAN